jgi:hypothetical protein
MAEYESRKIRGWRGLLDEAISKVRNRFWNVPAAVVYSRELESPGSDNLAGKPRWFNRVFGPERQAASAELLQLRKLKQRLRHAELTPEQREDKRARDHERYLQSRAKQSPEDRREQYAKVRARRAAHTEAEREHERAMCRQWRAGQDSDWQAKEVEKKRLRRLAKPELYKAIDKRSKVRTRDASNARKRARYAALKATCTCAGERC